MRQLSELDAEERLAMACEKAPTSDHATSKLRSAFRVLLSPSPHPPRASEAPYKQDFQQFIPPPTVSRGCAYLSPAS